MKDELTMAQMIWNALKDAPPELPGPEYTIEQIAVLCWRKYPQRFGMAGYQDRHPDLNKVVATIVGKGRMAVKGQLNRIGKSLYTLGREPPGPQPTTLGIGRHRPKPPPSEEHKKMAWWLGKLSSKDSYHKFRQHGLSKANRVDVMEFFECKGLDDLRFKVPEILDVVQRMRSDNELDQELVNSVINTAVALADTLPKSLMRERAS